MAVIGNRAATNYQTIRKQTITGTGATSYSLDYSVSSPNDLEVFVNNVRQEPTAAYTASGQTITFTAAVSSTDSVYIIYQGQTVGSVVHPSEQALSATTGTFSGAVSGTNGTFTGNVGIGMSSPSYKLDVSHSSFDIARFVTTASNTDARVNIEGIGTGLGAVNSVNNGLVFQVAGTERARIDSAGRVTMPYQPSWSAFATNGASLSTSGTPAKMPYSTEVTDIGGHYDASTSRFTAPVAGKYFVSFSALALGGGAMNLKLYKNGTLFSGANGHVRSITGTNEQNMGQSVVISLAANDYLEIFYNNDGASNQIYGAHGSFCGYLLG